jgi:hypothetical protein
VNIRRPEPRGEGVPEIVEMEITDPSFLTAFSKHAID